MSARPGRRVAAVVVAPACAAVLLALGGSWRGCTAVPHDDVDVRPTAPPEPQPRDRVRDDVRPRSRAAPERRAAVTPGRATSAASADGLPSVRVQVVDAAGAPRSAVVYALPEGRPGPRDDDANAPPVPLLATDGSGRCRLAVPVAGTYDVGAVDAAVHALAESVRIPSDEVVVVRLPQPAKVVCSFPDDWPPEAKAPDIQLVTDRRARRSGHPGRGEVLDVLIRVPWGTADAASADPGLPLELEQADTIRRPLHDVVFEPRRFSAPGSAVVRPAAFRMNVRVGFAPADRAYRDRAAFDVRFSWDPPIEDEFVESIDVGAGQLLGDCGALLRAGFSEPQAVLRWRGDGIVPGEVTMRADEGAAERAVTVEVGALPESSFLREGYSFRVEDGLSLPDGWATAECDETGILRMVGTVTAPDRATAGRGTKWVIAYDADRGAIAGPAPPAPSAGPLVIRRGGRIVVVPERDLPDGCRANIRRADGAPFVADGGATNCVECKAGLVLGPFEPGDISLEFIVAGAKPRTVVVPVVAGGYATLVVPARFGE